VPSSLASLRISNRLPETQADFFSRLICTTVCAGAAVRFTLLADALKTFSSRPFVVWDVAERADRECAHGEGESENMDSLSFAPVIGMIFKAG